MSQSLIRIVLVFSGLLTAAAPLFAHPLGVSYSRFVVQGATIGATIRLPMDDMDLLFELDSDLDGKVALGEIEAARPAIERYLVGKIRILADGEKPTLISFGEMKQWNDRDGTLYLETSLSYQAAREIQEIYIQVEVLTDLYSTHKNYAQIQLANRSQDFVFLNKNVFTTSVPSGFWRTVRAFLASGIKHTFSVYYPLMFLFALLLVGSGIRDLIRILVSFVIASNITLVLASWGDIQPLSSRVEECIALSIAYIGLENLLIKNVQHRWKITFVFGLIYGFGFANMLRGMDLSRSAVVIGPISFGTGLAIGQIAIASMLAPTFKYLDRIRWRVPVTRIVSLIIMGFGLMWFYQTVLGKAVV